MKWLCRQMAHSTPKPVAFVHPSVACWAHRPGAKVLVFPALTSYDHRA